MSQSPLLPVPYAETDAWIADARRRGGNPLGKPPSAAYYYKLADLIDRLRLQTTSQRTVIEGFQAALRESPANAAQGKLSV